MGDRPPARTFRDLLVWQKSYDIAICVYSLTKSFPPEERYGLCSQMQRASISVASNIAEAFGRQGLADKDRFYGIACGSLSELQNQLLLAQGIGYLNDIQAQQTYDDCDVAYRMLSALRKTHNSQRGE